METEHAKMTGDFYLDYSAHTLQYLQQLDSHDRAKKEYIYTIDDLDIENVAQTIMRGLKEGFSFKEVDWDTLENEATNENNDIACLIIFQAATPFSSRSEDRINARREKHPKVRNIIIVCIGRDRDGNHSKICSEKPFLMDHDIVFKYHIKADDSPHDCSRDVVGRIRLHLIIIVMGASYDALLLKHKELETELESEKQHSSMFRHDLEDSEKEKGASYDALLLKHKELETELESEKQHSRLLKQDLENSEKEKGASYDPLLLKYKELETELESEKQHSRLLEQDLENSEKEKGTSYDALLLKHEELEIELEREKQLSRLLKQDLENSEKEKEKLMDENNTLHKENKKTSQQLEQAYQIHDRLLEEYHKLKDQKTTGGDERKYDFI